VWHTSESGFAASAVHAKFRHMFGILMTIEHFRVAWLPSCKKKKIVADLKEQMETYRAELHHGGHEMQGQECRASASLSLFTAVPV
jgi:hypothetical protein